MLFEKIEKVASEAARVGIRTLGQRNSSSAAKSDRTSSLGGKKWKVTFFRGPRSASWPVRKDCKNIKIPKENFSFHFFEIFFLRFPPDLGDSGAKVEKSF